MSYDGMTDQLGRSQVLPYLCELSKLGVSYHLISFEKEERYKQNRELIDEIAREHQINWIPLSYTKEPPILSTVRDVRILKQKAAQLHSEHNFDLVHCRSYISSLAGLELKAKYSIPFLFDMRGFWADERVDGKIWNLKNPIYRMIFRYFKNKEKEFFTRSDKIISLTENGKNEIVSWSLPDVDSEKIEVIPCCADLSHFDHNRIDTAERVSLQKELGLTHDDLVISYLGAIGTWYMLDEMLDFFRVLKSIYSNAKFLIITAEEKKHIHDRAGALGVDANDLIIRYADRELVPLHLSLSSLSIFFIKPLFSKKASSPTKQGELMGMGIPIICNSGVGDTDMIIKESAGGSIIENFSDSEYRKVCMAIPELLKSDKEKIRSGAQKFYSLKMGVEKYFNVYKELCRVQA